MRPDNALQTTRLVQRNGVSTVWREDGSPVPPASSILEYVEVAA
jgi:hypothetical protein